MKYPSFNYPVTGVVVPLSALRSRKSAGIGEFADLPLLGLWAVSTGLQLIQILPVNDTGFERSPYSALSAYALHPVYARLENFPEASSGKSKSRINEEIQAFKFSLKSDTEAAGSDRINFNAVLTGKMRILKSMWDSASAADIKKAENWAGKNPWVINYALFSLLKEENGSKSWIEWGSFQNPGKKDLEKLWRKRKKDAVFWLWLQWRLETQFKTAAEELDSMGIALKGDIPILINDDSADVWAERSNFNLKLRAGSPDGQNWGFPTYNWVHLRSENFRWWRKRLDQAAKFYHAYRIDHVLGFFRIWAVPEEDNSAWNGHFQPSVPLTREDLESSGFDKDRIIWLSRAHFPGVELREVFGNEAPLIQKMLEQLDLEDLWRTRPDGPGEKKVAASTLSGEAKELLFQALRNRTLLSTGEDSWSPSINYTETRGWNSLSDDERKSLGGLIQRAAENSETLWEETGRELLEIMKGDGSMLVCAEDLGAIPACVPGVLEELGILGLKITRWARKWDEPGQPYIPFSEYPELSVSSSSVHDSTTLRGWLAGEARMDEELRIALGLPGELDLSGSTGVKIILEALQKTSSMVAAYPIQDLLALKSDCVSCNPEVERVNIPGTVQERNWTWRMKLSLEELLEHSELNEELKTLCSIREKVPPPGGSA